LKDQLENYIRSSISNPIDEEISDILNIFHAQTLRKGEFFKRQDQVCDKLGFIVGGSTRHYGIKKNGNEVTGRVSLKNDFVSE